MCLRQNALGQGQPTPNCEDLKKKLQVILKTALNRTKPALVVPCTLLFGIMVSTKLHFGSNPLNFLVVLYFF
jgi:hypothetical protein